MKSVLKRVFLALAFSLAASVATADGPYIYNPVFGNLGTAAFVNTGTSGSTLCLLSTTCSSVTNTSLTSSVTDRALQFNATPGSAASGQYIGNSNTVEYSSTFADSQQIYGEWGTALVGSSGFPNAANGVYGEAAYLGSANDGGTFSLYGGHFQSQVDTSGATVTHVIGVKVDGPRLVAGATATEAYGVYVQDMLLSNSGTITNGAPAFFAEGAGNTANGTNCVAFGGNGSSVVNSEICSPTQHVLTLDASTDLNLNTVSNAPIVAGGVFVVKSYTVATLPASPGVGAKAYVTDANALCSFGTVPTGGGSTPCPVGYNGTAWKEGY